MEFHNLRLILKLYCGNKLVYIFTKYPHLENLFLTRTSKNELIIITVNSSDVFVFLFNEKNKKCNLIHAINVNYHLNNYLLEYRDNENIENNFIFYNEDEKKLIKINGETKTIDDEKKIFTSVDKQLSIKKSYFDHYSNKIFLHLESDRKYQNICVLDIVNM